MVGHGTLRVSWMATVSQDLQAFTPTFTTPVSLEYRHHFLTHFTFGSIVQWCEYFPIKRNMKQT